MAPPVGLTLNVELVPLQMAVGDAVGLAVGTEYTDIARLLVAV